MAFVNWLNWDDTSFEKAKEESKLVLLFIVASWCRWSRSMEDKIFSNEKIIELMEKEFVPIRIDKDRRPDINERYNMGGWPSCAILTPDGEVITGGTYFDEEELAMLLEKVPAAYREKKDRIQDAIDAMVREEEEGQKEKDTRKGELSEKIITNVSRSIIAEFDEKYGGFGKGQKFPHSEAIDFAILQYARTNDLKLLGVVNKTLEEMTDGELFDPVGGGFFRYCATRDWRAPNTEKLLETNVGLLHCYATAYQVMGRTRYFDVAKETAHYICANLWDADYGAFRSSQDADDDYYLLDKLERRDRKPPGTDRTIYANTNAMAATVFLEVAPVLREPLLKKMACQAIEFILKNLYVTDRGVYHYFDRSRQILGLLTDQIYLCRALLSAVEFAGKNEYIEVIRDLLGIIVQKQSSISGGFYDISEKTGARGGLRRRNKSILENAVIADVLIRFYSLTFEEEYLQLAERTLASFARDYHLYGYFTAGYAKAVDLFFHKPLYVVIVGSKEDERTNRLAEEALKHFFASRVLLTIDPVCEKDLAMKMEFPTDREPTAYVCVEKTCLAAIRNPQDLKTAIYRALP